MSPVVLERRHRQPDRVRHATTRATTGIHTLERKEPLHTAAQRRLRRARADHRLPGAAHPHAGRREQRGKKKHVREDVPRGPAAGERRRHQQRRRLRRHRRSASATCSATSSSTSSPSSIAQYRTLVAQLRRTCRAASSSRCRASRRRSSSTASSRACSTIRRSRRSSAAIRRSRRGPIRGGSAFGIYPLDRFRRLEFSAGLVPAERGVQRSGRSRTTSNSTSSSSASRCSATARWCRSASRSSRRRRSSASSVRWPAARCASPTTSRRRSATRCRARPSTPTPATTSGWPAPACSRCAFRGFKSIGRLSRLHLLRRQLRNARLRLPAVRRPERGLRQRRTALPDHRGGADADRRHRRRPRRVLRQHGRRLVQQPGLQVLRPSTPRRTRRSSTTSATPSATSSSTRPPACRSRSTGRSRPISGFRLKDGRASYGIGLETFALGFPIHFDWSWRTLFNKDWEDVAVRRRRRQRRVPQAALRGLDRLRLLDARLDCRLWARCGLAETPVTSRQPRALQPESSA